VLKKQNHQMLGGRTNCYFCHNCIFVLDGEISHPSGGKKIAFFVQDGEIRVLFAVMSKVKNNNGVYRHNKTLATTITIITIITILFSLSLYHIYFNKPQENFIDRVVVTKEEKKMSIQIDDTMVHINDEDVPIAAVADTSKQGDEPEQLESTPCTTNTCTDDLKAMAGGSEEKITSVQNEAMKNEGPVPLDEKTNIKKDIGANSTTRTDKQDTIDDDDDDDDDDATNANSKINNGNNEKDIETAMSIPYQDQEGGGRNKKSSSLSPSPSPPNNNDEQLQQSFTTNSTSTPGAIAIDNPLFDGLTTTISGMMDASTATTTATSRNSSNPSSSLGPSRIETSLATTTDLHTTASTSLMSLMTHTAELGSSYHHVEAICIDEQTVYEATPVVNNDDSNHQDDSNGENDDDNDEENPSKNKQDQPSLKACFSRYRLYINIIIATVMIAAISIVLGIVLTGGQQQEAAQQTEEQQQRWEAMRAIVAPLSIGGEYEAIFDTENPESSSSSTDARIDALNWIVDIDPAKLPIDGGPDVEWKIRQRYVLALLYFSTNGSGWDEQYSFLSGFDECKWTSVQTQADDDDNPYRINGFEVKGVVCNREGEVETLRMCKLNG
jgi:hypothetical protein